MVRSTLPAISRVLLHLCNASLTVGIFPYKPSTANVNPFHKSDCKTNIHNYRLVSVLPVIINILERNARVEKYLIGNSVLSNCQSSLGKKINRNGCYAFENHIYQTFDNSEIYNAIHLYFSMTTYVYLSSVGHFQGLLLFLFTIVAL